MSFGTFMKQNQVFTMKLPKRIQNIKKESIRITIRPKNIKFDHKKGSTVYKKVFLSTRSFELSKIEFTRYEELIVTSL